MVPEWLLDADVSDRAVRLWAILDRYAGSNGAAFPSRSTLAKRLRCSVDTIDRSLADLEAVGALEVERAGTRVNVYRLLDRPRASRTDAARSSRTGAASASRTGAAHKESHTKESQENERTPSSDPAGSEVAAAPPFDPLKGKKVPTATQEIGPDGEWIEGVVDRNLPWDALVEETISHGQANEARVGKALKSIRAEAWARAQENGLTLDEVQERWGAYERGLAEEIRRRVRWLNSNRPDLTWGAEGVARWWSRIPASDATEVAVEEAVRRVRERAGAEEARP